MKKIEFYILDIENDDNALMYHNKFDNSLISYSLIDTKWYFNSHFEPMQEISYSYRKVKMSSDLETTIRDILLFSYNEAKSISEENMGVEKEKGSIQSAIMSIINRYSYYGNEEKDVFDLFNDIFIRIMMGHYLYNGNKRLAITFLKGFLWHFGYYLKWSDGMWKNYTEHKTTVEVFVKKLEENDGPEQRSIIKTWIMNNVIIGLNWR